MRKIERGEGSQEGDIKIEIQDQRKHICLLHDPKNNHECPRGSKCTNDHLDSKQDREITRCISANQAVHKKAYDPKESKAGR